MKIIGVVKSNISLFVSSEIVYRRDSLTQLVSHIHPKGVLTQQLKEYENN